MAKPYSVTVFIRECLTDKEKEPDKLSQFTLFHIRGERESELYSMRIPDKGANVDADELATVFYNKAENYASDIAGVQVFNIVAFWGNPNVGPKARKPFSVNGKQDYAGATEPPNDEGERGQKMRHREAQFGLDYRRSQQLDDHAIRLLGRYEALNTQLMGALQHERQENLDLFGIFKEMALAKVTEDRQHEMAKIAYERSTEERRALLRLVPALANTITGTEVFPQAVEDTALINLIADGMARNPDAIKAIAATGAIKPEVLGPLITRFQKRQAEREREDEERKNLLPPPKDPVADARGDAMVIGPNKAAE